VTRDQARVSVFHRLGLIKQNKDEQCFNQKVGAKLQKGTGSMQQLQWHPSGMFTRSLKWRVQRLRDWEKRKAQLHEANCEVSLVRKAWRPKLKSKV
jgi:hypothetical protein